MKIEMKEGRDGLLYHQKKETNKKQYKLRFINTLKYNYILSITKQNKKKTHKKQKTKKTRNRCTKETENSWV